MTARSPIRVSTSDQPVTVRAILRVSTPGQVKDGHGLDAQRSSITAWCTFSNLPAPIWYSDAGVSGQKKSRPAIDRLMLELEAGDVVVTSYLSRLSRRGASGTRQMIDDVLERGARFVSLRESIDTSAQTWKLLAGLFGALAEDELEKTREGSISGRIEAARKGLYPATPPFGYSLEKGRLVPNERAVTVKRIFELAQTQSLWNICARLERENVPTVRGGRWVSATIWFILRTTAYHGLAVYRKGRYNAPGIMIECEPIVTPEVWNGAQRSSDTRGKRNIESYPLSGHLKCAHCGCPMSGHKKRSTLYYVCSSAGQFYRQQGKLCSSPKAHRAELLEANAAEIIAATLNDSTALEMLNFQQSEQKSDPRTPERTRLKLELENLIAALRVGAITPQEMLEQRAPIDRALAKLETRAPAVEKSLTLMQHVTPKMLERIRNARGTNLNKILEALSVKMKAFSDGELNIIEVFVPREWR